MQDREREGCRYMTRRSCFQSGTGSSRVPGIHTVNTVSESVEFTTPRGGGGRGGSIRPETRERDCRGGIIRGGIGGRD